MAPDDIIMGAVPLIRLGEEMPEFIIYAPDEATHTIRIELVNPEWTVQVTVRDQSEKAK